MATIRNYDNYKYIDSFGNELPWGCFVEASCFHRGWAEIVTQRSKNELFWGMLNRDGRTKVQLGGTPLEIIKKEALSKGHFALWDWTDGFDFLVTLIDWEDHYKLTQGIWSYKQNRWLIAPEYSFASLRYTEQGIIPLLAPDGKLLHADKQGGIVSSYRVPEFIVNRFGEVKIHDDEEGGVCILKEWCADKTDYTKHEFALLDVLTGESSGIIKLRALGLAGEQKRYAIDTKGNEIVTDRFGQFLFKLPFQSDFVHNTKIVPTPVSEGIKQDEFKYRFQSGRLSLPYWDNKGKRHCYMVDSNGEVVIPPGVYDGGIIVLGNNRILVCKNSKWALADTHGELLTDFLYTPNFRDWSMKNNRIVLGKRITRSRVLQGALDESGNEVIPFNFQCIYSCSGESHPFEDNAALIRIR